MTLMIRQIAAADTLERRLCLDALAQVAPPPTIAAVLAEGRATEAQSRKIPALVPRLFCIAMNLYAADDLAHVFRRLVSDRRTIATQWPPTCGSSIWCAVL